MTISMNDIPNALRVPFLTAEFNASRATQGPALLALRGLIIGQALDPYAANADTLVKVTNADQVVALAGRGSMLHRQALAWFAGNKSTEVYVGILQDSAAGVVATGTLTVTGPATADGTLSLWIGGTLVEVAVASGDTATEIATAIVAAVGRHSKAVITFDSAGAGDDIEIAGVTFVATAGAVTPGDATYSYATGDTETAASLVAQVAAHETTGPLMTASAATGVATFTAKEGGPTLIGVTPTDVVSCATVETAGTADTDLPVHATSVAGVVTLHARNNGLAHNALDVRLNYNDGEETPAGVAVAIVAMASGTTAPALTNLISAMGDQWFNIIAHPYTDATNLAALEAELSSRFGPLRMIDGSAITAKHDTLANMSTLGDSRNSPHNSILRTNDSPTPAFEYAAHVAAVAAYYLGIDPARPLQTLPLPWIKAPADADLDTIEERNVLLYDGISTTKVAAGGVVQIERIVTTYQTNAAGSPDEAYLDLTTMATLSYLRYSWRVRVAAKWPRHKLANDGTRVTSGQAIVTPLIGKAEALSWFRDMEDLGLVEGFDQFKADLVVERNALNPNRMDWLLSPDIINQLIVGATQFQFLL